MSFDKLKAMRSAERFLTQGKITDAIKEYTLLVENDPKDFNTMNMLGDLYVKIDNKDQAVSCFTKVAEHYSKQGFAQKAIAIYNKVARLTPNSVEVSAKLAPLYHLKGSIADAKTHYSIVADAYQNEGKKIEALNIWKRIAELDPNNTEIYLKLAEGYWNENQKEEAAVSFIEAGTRLASIRKYEKAVEAFSRALEIKPTDYIALNGYVSSQISIGQADDACELLERLQKDNPYNTEILLLLADCYIGNDNPIAAEKVVINLVEKEPSNYSKFLDVVSSYLKENNIDSSIRVLNMASEHLLVGGKAEEYKSITEEILARNPEQLDALRLLVRFHAWMRDEAEHKKALERMADVAQLNGVLEDEKYALSLLVNIPPFEPKYAQRLEELGGATSIEQLSVDSVGFTATVVENEVPQFETFENFSKDGEPVSKIQQDAIGNTSGFSFSANDQTVQADETVQSFENDFATNNAEEADTKLSPSLEMHLHQELESVDFYISNDYNDLAVDTLNVLEKQFGKHPEIQSRKEKLGIITPEFLGSPQVENAEAETEDEMVVVGREQVEEENKFENFAQTEDHGFDFGMKSFENIEKFDDSPEVEQIQESEPESVQETERQFQDFRSDLGFEETEETSDDDYETHFSSGIAYKEMGLLDQSAGEFQDAVQLVKPNDGTRRHFQCCNWLGHCFMEKQMPKLAITWFEKCFETLNLSTDESRGLYYEVAVANQEEGDTENAIRYFEQIYGEDVSYRDVSERLKKLKSQ
jgi:tetratricopeptide (TPR) repeat protein